MVIVKLDINSGRKKLILKRNTQVTVSDPKYTFNHVKKINTSLSYLAMQFFNRYRTKLKTEWSILQNAKINIGDTRKMCKICNLEHMAQAAEDKKIF